MDFFANMNTDVLTGFGGVILGFVLTEVIGFFRRKSETTTRFIESNYVYRQQAYSDLYIALIKFKKYFASFIVSDGDEFSERRDYEVFAPLTTYDDFRTKYQEVELWLPENIRVAVENVLQQSMVQCNIGLNIASNRIKLQQNPNEEVYDYSDDVKKTCEKIVTDIEVIYDLIIIATGMNQLSDYHSKRISK